MTDATDPLIAAACAYVLARESGRPTTSRYRALRRAWVAKVRADDLALARMLKELAIRPTEHLTIEWGEI